MMRGLRGDIARSFGHADLPRKEDHKNSSGDDPIRRASSHGGGRRSSGHSVNPTSPDRAVPQPQPHETMICSGTASIRPPPPMKLWRMKFTSSSARSSSGSAGRAGSRWTIPAGGRDGWFVETFSLLLPVVTGPDRRIRAGGIFRSLHRAARRVLPPAIREGETAACIPNRARGRRGGTGWYRASKRTRHPKARR